MPARFLDPLDIRDKGDGKNWIVLHEFRFVTRNGDVITVPAGAETDFASIPRFFWRIAAPSEGKHRKGAVVHDWLYRTPTVPISKARADDIFLEAMTVEGTPWAIRLIMYRAVSLFGGGSYRKRELEITPG